MRNKIKRLLRENYKNMEENLKRGYSIVFLIKKDVNIESLTFNNIKQDMLKIFQNSKLIVMD